MKESNRGTLIPKILSWGIGGILLIAPFYAPLTVVGASQLHHFDLLRIWKEVALTGLGLTTLYFLLTNIKQTKLIIKERLFQLVLVYSLLLVAIAILDVSSGRVSTPAVIYGLMIDLRLVGFFMVVYLAFKTKQLNQSFAWWKFLLIPAVIVVVFGLLQMLVLPKDVLSHIGYSKATIVPYQTVDNNPDFVRVQSSLRGPNPLGAYLVVVVSTLGALIIAGRRTQHRNLLLIFLTSCLVLLFGTYSRSAYLGTLLALITLFVIQIKKPRWLNQKIIVGLILSAIIAIAVTLSVLKKNYIIDTVFLHSNSKSSSPESSNSQRQKALLGASQDVISHPLGGGVGSAGPASLRNTKHLAKISENYYLQVGQEVGWLGMVLFSAITIVVGVRLYKLRRTVLGAALISSLLGLTLVNMLSHAWADDTLAYVWWGLAGIALAHNIGQPDILIKKRKNHG